MCVCGSLILIEPTLSHCTTLLVGLFELVVVRTSLSRAVTPAVFSYALMKESEVDFERHISSAYNVRDQCYIIIRVQVRTKHTFTERYVQKIYMIHTK